MSRNKEHRPNGAAAEGGRPIGAPPKAAPVFLIINLYGYALYIPYIFFFRLMERRTRPTW